MIREVQVALLSLSFSFESMLVRELVVNVLTGENRAGTAEGVGWLGLERARAREHDSDASGERHSCRGIAALCVFCASLVSLSSRPNPGLLVLDGMASGCITNGRFEPSLFTRNPGG